MNPVTAEPGHLGAGDVLDFDAETVLGLKGDALLREFNRAGVLSSVDVHVALCLARLGGEHDELVKLGAAFAVRAPRVGHVHVDLATVRSTAAADVETELDVEALAWPDPSHWVGTMAASGLVGTGRPLRLVGTTLYLDRYWRDEKHVAADLLSRAGSAPSELDREALERGLDRLFPDGATGEQGHAAAQAVARRFSVITGGPGTGKTTTVARVLALLEEQSEATGTRSPLVALAAPTGKAAQRMAETLRGEAARMDIAAPVRHRLMSMEAVTVHRLLAALPGSSSRFRYDRLNRLPHDVVIVDETSMVSLWLMARLVEAVRPDARLVLVGDPQQLASVEAGAILADIVGPLAGPPSRRRGAAEREEPATAGTADVPLRTGTADAPLRAGTAEALPNGPQPGEPRGPDFDDCISVLRTNHRFGGALTALADAVRAGDRDAALQVLATGAPSVEWYPVELSAGREPPEGLRAETVRAGARMVGAALAGDYRGALDLLDRARVLCAHRTGPAGVSTWNQRLEEWLAAEIQGFYPAGTWYPGRPVIVTANDYNLRLFNGDTGIAVANPRGQDEPGLSVVFERSGGPYFVSPSRLQAVATAYAMTIHRGQGSEAAEVVVILPQPGSRALTRELLYTAVTRARHRLVVVGTEGSVAAALARPVARASGLGARLRPEAHWPSP